MKEFAEVETNKTSLGRIEGFGAAVLLLVAALAAGTPAGQTVFEKSPHHGSLAAHFIPSDIPESAVVPEALNGLYDDPLPRQVIHQSGASGIVCAEDSSFLGTTSR